MKNRVISALLCICLIASVFTMAVSAAAVNVTISIIDPLKLDQGSKVKASDLSKYLELDSSSTVTLAKILEHYSATVETTDTQLNVTFSPSDATAGSYFLINGSTNPATLTRAITWVKPDYEKKLYDLSIGVRKYGENGGTLVADEIANVTYRREDGTTGQMDKIFDLKYGESVHLEAKIKEEYDDFYAFSCWLDGSGNVRGYSEAIDVTFAKTVDNDTVTSGAMYAVYKEIVDRFTVTLIASSTTAVAPGAEKPVGGKIIYNSDLKVFDGKGIVSVLQGTSPKFTFVPDEGYYVSKVVVDGTVVSSVKTLLSNVFSSSQFDDALKAFGTFSDATNKDVYTYILKNVQANHTIEVVFDKVKVFVPASGVSYVAGPELSTGATEAAAADGDAAATTLPAENNGAASVDGVVNPATGSTAAIAVFATLSIAAAAAFVSYKKKES